MWTAIIAGSGLGVGAITALIFYVKASKAEGRAAVAELQRANFSAKVLEQSARIVDLQAATSLLVQSQKDALARRDAVIKSYEERVEKLNDLLSKSTVPAVVIARVGQLFPVPKKDNNG